MEQRTPVIQRPRFWYRASDDQYILLTEDIERPIVDAVRRCALVFIAACSVLEIVAAVGGVP